MFPNAVAEYAKLDRSLIHSGVAVNSKEGIALLKDMQPDVVVCFGGPVYRQAFIEACPMVLNYHSGVSPLYNGTASARFAFANGHPHLCGGTLMKMSAVVDGGDLLGHFLPAIDERDTPATLFMKTAHGAATMYHGCLAHLEREGSNWAGLPQGRPLFYFRSADWTVHHGQRVRAHLRAGRAGKFQRPERVLNTGEDETRTRRNKCLKQRSRACSFRNRESEAFVAIRRWKCGRVSRIPTAHSQALAGPRERGLLPLRWPFVFLVRGVLQMLHAGTIARRPCRTATVYQFAPLQRAVEFINADERPAQPYLAVTFGGFDQNQPEFLALFDEFGVKVTTFVITSKLDNQNLMWRNPLSGIRPQVDEQTYVKKLTAPPPKLVPASRTVAK